MAVTFGSNDGLYAPLLSVENSSHTSHPAMVVQNCGNGKYWDTSSHRRAMRLEAAVDPFRNTTPHIEGIYEVLKMVICVPIAVLRLLLLGASIAVGYLFTLLALCKWKDKSNPMPRWRSCLMLATRFCGRVILFSFGYQWIRRRGKPAPREVAPIVVSNHLSYIEPIFFFYDLFPTIVASESHDSLPLVGAIIRAMQVIYVNRFSSSSRKHAVNEIKRLASCNGYRRLLLFPEGTTTNGKALLSFKLGAFIPGCAIQPVVVRYPFVHFDQSWGDISLLKLMIRMFLQFHNFMEVEYLPVIFPTEKCREDPSHFAARVRHAIAASLNVPQSFHSFGDNMLLQKASEAKHVNPSSFLVEMSRVESLFHISISEALDLLDKFLRMNPDSSGCVKFSEFSRVLGFPSSSLAKEAFCFVDANQEGTVAFKQFIYACGHLKRQPLFQQLCLAAFSRCGKRDGGDISPQEFAEAIQLVEALRESEIRDFFRRFDCDGVGSLSRDAFVASMRRNPLFIVYFIPLSDWHALISASPPLVD